MSAADQAVTAAQAPLTREEIESFVHNWYRRLDLHASPDVVVQLVAEDGMRYWEERDTGACGTQGLELVLAPPVEFVLPEGPMRGVAAFRSWYEGVICAFFDEVHTIEGIDVSWQGRQALVKVKIEWEARRWNPPAARSEWVGFDVDQDWVMVRSATTACAVVLRYVVNELVPMPGSPDL